MSQSVRQVMAIENIWKFVRMSLNTLFKLDVTFVSNRLRLFVSIYWNENKSSIIFCTWGTQCPLQLHHPVDEMMGKKYSDAIFDTLSAKVIIL